ncbi:MAG: molybdenum cofactor biosynthesis protein MoaE [Chloroflexi bacterium]|nr:molybdenum cofactor biosynthesis protein MoaE [Chloroflexota bacterium]
MFEITTEPLSVDPLIELVRKDADGAVVAFVGVVREVSKGKRVKYLEYDAYKEMAEAKLKQIGDEIQERWHLSGVAIRHRIGHMEIGETSVVIAVAAPHRREGLEACQYAIDRLKEIVPIWKKEVYEDGEVWVGSGD